MAFEGEREITSSNTDEHQPVSKDGGANATTVRALVDVAQRLERQGHLDAALENLRHAQSMVTPESGLAQVLDVLVNGILERKGTAIQHQTESTNAPLQGTRLGQMSGEPMPAESPLARGDFYAPQLQTQPYQTGGHQPTSYATPPQRRGIPAWVWAAPVLILILVGAGFGAWFFMSAQEKTASDARATATAVTQAAAATSVAQAGATSTAVARGILQSEATSTAAAQGSNADLLKEAAANMKAAKSYHLLVNANQAGQEVQIDGDIDVGNNKSKLAIAAAGQNINTISIGSATYLSTDGGKTYTNSPGSSSLGLESFMKMWDSFKPEDVDKAKDAIKDGTPKDETVGSDATRHMTANTKDLAPLASSGNSSTTDGTIDIWVTTGSTPTVRKIQIKGASNGSELSATLEWTHINQSFIINAPAEPLIPTNTVVSVLPTAILPLVSPAPNDTAVPQATSVSPTAVIAPPTEVNQTYEFLGGRFFKDSIGNLNYVGSYRYHGAGKITNPIISVTLLDASKNVLGTGQSFSNPNSVNPGGLIPFKVLLTSAPDKWADSEVRISADDNSFMSDILSADFEVSGTSLIPAKGYNPAKVVGRIKNIGSYPVNLVGVYVAFYDASDKILDVGFTFVGTNGIAPGVAEPFEVSAYEVKGAAKYEVVASGFVQK